MMHQNLQAPKELSSVETQIRDWPEGGLEHLGRCPVCGCTERRPLYRGIVDKMCRIPGRWTYYDCSGCGSAYVDPRPNQVTIGTAYTNYATHKVTEPPPRSPNKLSRLLMVLRNDYINWRYGYNRTPACSWGRLFMCFLPPFLRDEWAYFARCLPRPVRTLNRVIDVGCGNGDFLLRVREAGWNGLGVDFDPVAVDVARGRGVNVLLGSIEAQPLEDASFQALTLSHVIEHIHAPVAFLRECLRLLEPGGFMWVATPNRKSVGHRHYGSNWHFLIHPPNHLVLFSPESLCSALKEAGAVQVKVRRRGFHVGAMLSYFRSVQMRESQSDAKLPKRLLPWSLALECWDSLFPQFQEELIVTAYKKG